jgi:E3 ubiquitin-protein ligase UBR1
LSTITKLLATSVASNFRTLFEFDFDYSMTSMLSPSVLSLSPSSQSQSQQQAQQQPAASTSMVCSLVATATESNSDIKLHAETVTTMENFARISYTYGFATFPNDDDYRMPISVWTNCAYTIQVIEQLLSFESKPLFGRFSVKQVELLSSIVKQAALYGMAKNTESVRKNCVRLLALILPYNKTALIDEAKSIIEIDMFHLLVSLCLSMPNLYEETPKLSLVSNGGLNDFNVFKLVLQAHCVQIFLAKLKYSSFCGEDESKSVCEEFDVREHDVDSVYEFFRYLFGLSVEKNILKFTDEEKAKITKIKKIDVYVSLVKGLMPFLRCSALFFSNLTGLAPIAQISGNLLVYKHIFEIFINVYIDLYR